MSNGSPPLNPCNFLLLEPNYRTFTTILNGVVTTFCVLIGCIGNVNTLLVIHKLNFHKNRGIGLGVSLIALAIWDTVLLVCALLYYGLASAALGVDMSYHFTEMGIFFHPITSTANTASVWFIVVITIQRCMASRNPFGRKGTPLLAARAGHSNLQNRKSSAVSIYYIHRRKFRVPIAVSALAALVNLPTFFELTNAACLDTLNNQTVTQVWPTEFRRDGGYTLYYRVVGRIIFNSFGPFILILGLTVLTLIQLRLVKRDRLQLGMDRHGVNATEQCQLVISITLIVKFLVLRWLPSGLDLWEATTNYSALNTRAFMYTVDVSNFLVILNSATNCLVYLRGKTLVQEKLMIKGSRTPSWRPRIQTERNTYIVKSWPKMLAVTDQKFGMRVIYAMVRTAPHLSDHFACLRDRDSFDLLSSERFRRTSHAVTLFFNDLVNQLNKRSLSDKELCTDIQRVGLIHYNLGIHFNVNVWREFKLVVLSIAGQCDYASENEHESTLNAWNTFISVIIRHMKLAAMPAFSRDESVSTV